MGALSPRRGGNLAQLSARGDASVRRTALRRDRFPRAARGPWRNVSSITTGDADLAPLLLHQLPRAPGVPPVASRSSTTATFFAGAGPRPRALPACPSRTRARTRSGSVCTAAFRDFEPARTDLQRSARAARRRSRRDSIARMRSNPRPRSRSSSASRTCLQRFRGAQDRRDVLEEDPRWGKSGTSRIRRALLP